MNAVSRDLDAAAWLGVPAEKVLAQFRPPEDAVSDPGLAARRALEAPREFPPFRQALVPGDRVTLAPSPGVPRAADIVAGVVEALIDWGVDAGAVTLLQAPGDAPIEVLPSIRRETHDPDTRARLALLGQTRDGRPIYLSRHLVEADVVLPIGCPRTAGAGGHAGVGAAIWPTFSDAETLSQVRQRETNGEAAESGGLKSTADEVCWLLGVALLLEVAPGAGGGVHGVLAGSPQTVQAWADEMSGAWRFAPPNQADLAVVLLSGDPRQQTWENVGRAAALATQLVEDRGAILIGCDVDTAPDKAVASLGRHETPADALRSLRKSDADDVAPAAQLARAQEQANVYLLSRLPEEHVADLGLTPLTSDAEVTRLARRFDRIVLVSDGQHVQWSNGAKW